MSFQSVQREQPVQLSTASDRPERHSGGKIEDSTPVNGEISPTGERPPAGASGDVDPSILDLDHLTRQCLGDVELAADLVAQFRAQVISTLTQLGADARPSLSEAADIAHRLKGSSLAIGAPSVARAAAAVETCARGGRRGRHDASDSAVELSLALSTLRGAIADVIMEIDRVYG
jgi:HPt (histidine-containing phosphotransfer) domain-containing protein